MYGADIPYRIFFAIVFATVFSWSFKFNPSPWAPQMTLTTAPPAFISFIQFKVIVEGYMILLLADVLRNFRVVKRILLLDDKSEGKSDYFISGSILFGFVFWIASGIADHIYSTDNSTLADHLILNVSPQEVTERLFVMFMCLVAGLIISNYFSKYRASSRLLKKSETHYRNLFSSIRDVIVMADKERNITNINQPALREQFGYELEEIKGEQTSVLYATKEGFQQTGIEVYDSDGKGIGKIMEMDLKKKDGTIFPSELYASKLFDENNEIIGNLGIIRDITERKISEMKLQEANNIINRSPVVAFLWKNSEGWPVEYVSRGVESLFGYSDKEFTDGSVSYADVIHPDDIQRVGEEVASFSSEAGINEFKHKPYRIVNRDNNVKWVEDITQKRKGDNGAITHYQGIVFDITEQ
ncbi:MAG: PAS domain S-box protein, partial [Desulfobacteraceae bacterium]|nr:PAS domain S-box protein [Desulfobacteraceae bacterium]